MLNKNSGKESRCFLFTRVIGLVGEGYTMTLHRRSRLARGYNER